MDNTVKIEDVNLKAPWAAECWRSERQFKRHFKEYSLIMNNMLVCFLDGGGGGYDSHVSMVNRYLKPACHVSLTGNIGKLMSCLSEKTSTKQHQ